jgi:hypothetical protein
LFPADVCQEISTNVGAPVTEVFLLWIAHAFEDNVGLDPDFVADLVRPRLAGVFRTNELALREGRVLAEAASGQGEMLVFQVWPEDLDRMMWDEGYVTV